MKNSLYMTQKVSAPRSITVTAALHSTGIALPGTGIKASLRGTGDIFVLCFYL